MRLIDADALKENLKNLILPNIPEEGEEGNFGYATFVATGFEDARQMLEEYLR